MPREILVAKEKIHLTYPEEAGVSADFIECFIYNVYGLGKQLGNVRTILDVGANVGFFSLAARSYYPDAIIHAYEPNPRIQDMLYANTKKASVNVYPDAVGAYTGRIGLIDDSVSNMAHTDPNLSGENDVEQIGLDAAVGRLGGSVDLLKMDCEGAEWKMFQVKHCWSSIKNVRLEYHLFGGETEQDVVTSLSDLGFRIVRLDSSRTNMGIIWGKRN